LEFGSAALIRPGEIAAAAEQLKPRLLAGRIKLIWCGGAATVEFGAEA
jgi:hypothetical protein